MMSHCRSIEYDCGRGVDTGDGCGGGGDSDRGDGINIWRKEIKDDTSKRIQVKNI